jgi:acyl-CoA synthetase (AMP-forming)/AMP-acid ligase II
MILLDRFAQHARNRPDDIALREVCTGRTMSWSKLATEVNDLSSRLRQLPLPGPIILRCPNVLEYHIAFLGALLADRPIFPVAPDIADAELNRAIAICGARYTLTETLRAIEFPANGSSNATLIPDGPALLLQSSGTTGLPKIVLRDARAIDAAGQNIADALGISPNDRILATVPLCHSYGVEHGLLAPMLIGARVDLVRGFDMPAIARELSAGITLFPGVPSIFEMLANIRVSTATLRCAYAAGAPLPASVISSLAHNLGLRVGQIYGTTEFGSATFNDPHAVNFDPLSVGMLMRGVDARIDPNSLLSIRAPSMFTSYVGEPSPLTHDGFFSTGDLARRDDLGRLYITGRSKLLIDIGGLKVNPLEVEAVLASHPEVEIAIIVPVKVTDTISRLKALIVPRDPAHPPALEELRSYTRSQLTPYKVPRIFEIRNQLPRSATGKILRHLLVEAQ